MLIPYEIETLQQERPWANWLIVGACTLVSLIALFGGGLKEGDFDSLILDGFSFPGFLGHVLLHADLIHLAGNMIFLWVFGNAICTNVSNRVYLAIFFACIVISAAVHVVADGELAIGASGAINGIVGMTLAMYPLNRVHLFWFFFIQGGTFDVRAWVIILVWFLFDLWGAFGGSGSSIAYAAHLGGLIGGFAVGMVALHFRWVQLTEFDKPLDAGNCAWRVSGVNTKRPLDLEVQRSFKMN